jgi:N4-gp56 family major capsid protein
MAVTNLQDIINPQVMGDMIEAKLPHMIKVTPFAKVDTTLVGVPGDTKTVPSWNFIGAAEDVAEGEEIATKKLTASSTTFTIKKAMQSVGITQEAINSGLGDPVGQAEIQLAKSMALKVDDDALVAALSGTQTYDGTDAAISYDGIVDAIDVLNEEEITDKVLFVHPSQVTTLRKDPDFTDANKYIEGVMVSGEIGMIAGARIVPSRKIMKVQYTKDNTSGTITIVADTTAETATSKHLATIQPVCVEALVVGDKVKAVTAPYYRCPLIKLEPASPETEYTEDELAAITIFLKRDTMVDHEWFPKRQSHDITASKYYGVALTNEAKVVVASFKA